MESGRGAERRDNDLVLDRLARSIRRFVETVVNLSGRGDKDVAQVVAKIIFEPSTNGFSF